MDKPQIKIVKYSTIHKLKLIDLLKYMWINLDENARLDRFEWRYENNPYQEKPFIYLAFNGEKLAGLRAFVVQRFCLKGINYMVFSPADAIVHPDYRRMGIFTKLNAAFLEDIDNSYLENSVILNLSSNKYSTSGNLKQGWQKTNGSKKYSLKVSTVNFLKTKIFGKDAFDRLSDLNISIKRTYQMIISKKLDNSEITDFLAKTRDKEKITNIRDEKYFRWRYAYQGEKYRYIYYIHGDELVGYCIISKLSNIQYFLEEYHAIDSGILKSMIKHAAIGLNIPLLRTMVTSDHQKIQLRKCGLIPEPEFLLKILKVKRLPVIVKPLNPEPSEDNFFINGVDIRKIENWLIFQADKH
jgi:hypothetical protein